MRRLFVPVDAGGDLRAGACSAGGLFHVFCGCPPSAFCWESHPRENCCSLNSSAESVLRSEEFWDEREEVS